MPTNEERKRYFIETFGCQMNVFDSQRAIAQLDKIGYDQTEEVELADLILFNTCSVRERPAEKVLTRILEVRHRKKPEAWIGVMGCVAQSEGKRLTEVAPDVRLVIGTQTVGRLGPLVQRVQGHAGVIVETATPNRAEFAELAPADRRPDPVAFVTITEGCDKFCTFCIVPFTRGRERSRSPERILSELQQLAARGVKETHLLGQNVNSYGLGRRIEGRRISFARLLEACARNSGIDRIKYTTSHPRDFTEEIIAVMDSWPQLCPWIHLPAQSGSDQVLAAMNRGYTFRDYMRKVEVIRKGEKDYSLTGDMIVGFPGETDADFQQTLALVREARFDSLYVFKYSPRPGTVADKWHDSVPDDVKRERLQELIRIQEEIQKRLWARYLGKNVKVLVEGRSAKSENHWSGHTDCHKTINFESSMSNQTGHIVEVEVTKINPHSLFGRQVEPDAVHPA